MSRKSLKSTTVSIDVEVPYRVYVVRSKTSGGRYVSVRKIDERKFRSILITGANDPNFDQPIHNSFRLFGEEDHTITLISTHETKEEANEAKANLIAENIEKGLAILNANMLPEGVRLESSDDAGERLAKKLAAKKAKKQTETKVAEAA